MPLSPVVLTQRYRVGKAAAKVCVHLRYMQGRTEGNSTMLKQVLFPMLRAFVQVYNHHRFIDDDDVMHLPYTNSPEYPKQLPGNDTNYDVAYEMRVHRLTPCLSRTRYSSLCLPIH